MTIQTLLSIFGLGSIGVAMLPRLLALGHPDTVWTYDLGKATPLLGASLKLAVNLPLLVYWQAMGEVMSSGVYTGLATDLRRAKGRHDISYSQNFHKRGVPPCRAQRQVA